MIQTHIMLNKFKTISLKSTTSLLSELSKTTSSQTRPITSKTDRINLPSSSVMSKDFIFYPMLNSHQAVNNVL